MSVSHIHPLIDTILQVQKEHTQYIMIGYCHIAAPDNTSYLNLLRIYTSPLSALTDLAELLGLNELPDWMLEGEECLHNGSDCYRAGDCTGFQYLIIPARKFDRFPIRF